MAGLQKQEASPSALPLVTLPLRDPRKSQLESVLGLQMMSIRQQDIFPHGMCYWNVDAVVHRYGGSAVVGWQCIWWPDRLLVAIHHAIWKKPNGELLDITQKDCGDLGHDTSFCEDPSVAVDLLWPMFVPNKYIILRADKEIGKAVSAFQEQIEAAREAVDYVKRKEGTFFPGKGLSLPSGTMPRTIRNRIHTANVRRQRAVQKCLARAAV